MITIDIQSPVFRIILEKNVNYLERSALQSFKDGWYPVGGIGRKGNDWVQVMVKELCTCKNPPIFDRECPAHGTREIPDEEFAAERSEIQSRTLMDEKITGEEAKDV